MGIEAARLYALVQADVSGAERNLDRFSNKLEGTARGAKNTGSSLGTLEGAASGLGNVLGAAGLTLSIAGVTAGVVGLGQASLQLAQNAEQNEIAFTTMLGSGERARAFLGELRDFAARTPFQFTELVDASKRMMALGFASEDVLPTLTAVGNAAAALGGGSETIDGITRALGQMAAKGKVSAEEMQQLAERGVPAWQYLADALGVTTGEAMKLAERGLIPVAEAQEAILAGMRNDFGGLMAASADTAAGRMSNLTDKLEVLGTTIGTKLLPAQNKVVDMLSSAADAAQLLFTWNDRLNESLVQHGDAVALSANDYAGYSTEMERAAKAAGFQVDAQGQLTRTIMTSSGPRQEIINSTFRMSEAMFNAARATAEYGLALDEDEKAARLAAIAQHELAGAVTGNTLATGDATTVYKDAAAMLRDYNIGAAARLEIERALKLASGEITLEDVEREKALGFLTKQLGLGNITQQQYIDKLNALALGAATARDIINETGRAIQGLQDKDVNVNFRFNRIGDPPPEAGEIGIGPVGPASGNFTPGGNVPTPTTGGFASGGSFLVPGTGNGDRPYIVGLTPGELVNITPRREVAKAVSDGNGERTTQPGVTNHYYLTAQYKYQDERELLDDVRFLAMMSGVM